MGENPLYTDHALNSPRKGEASARSNLTLSHGPWGDFVVFAATASVRAVPGARHGRECLGVSFSLFISKGWMGAWGRRRGVI